MVTGGAEEKGKHIQLFIPNLLKLYIKLKQDSDDESIEKSFIHSPTTRNTKVIMNTPKEFKLASMDDFPALDGNLSKDKLNGECGKVRKDLKARKVLNVVSANAQNQVQNGFGSQKTTINSMVIKKTNRLTTSTTSSSSTPRPVTKLMKQKNTIRSMKLLLERMGNKGWEKTSDSFLTFCSSCEGSDREHLMIVKRCAEELVKDFTGCLQPSVILEIHQSIKVVVIFNDKLSLRMEECITALGNIGDEVITPGVVFHFSVLYLKLIMEQGFAPYFTTKMLSGLQKTLKRNCPFVKGLKLVIEKELTLRAGKSNGTLPFYPMENSEDDEFVQWECETNNRHTFSTDSQFDAFIKQRDFFCEVFQDWVQESERGGENDAAFKNKMKVAMRDLVDKVKKHSNYKPFIRLFLSQLCLGCRKEYSNPVVKNVPPSGPSVQFPHHSFFKEFIENNDSYALQNQMCDSIMTTINQLQGDDAYTFCSEDSAYDSAPTTLVLADFRDKLCLIRSLGNFLGYLVFNCFRNCADKPGAIDNIEGDRLPSMPFSVCSFALDSIRKALKNGHILPTLTWIVQTLSFIPPNVLWLHTGCLDECLLLLVKIFTRMKKKEKQSFSNLQMITISTIGFLFEPNVLGEETFRNCFERMNSVLGRYEVNPCSIDKLASFCSPSNLLPATHWRLTDCESLVTSQLPTSSWSFGVTSENTLSFRSRTKKLTDAILRKSCLDKRYISVFEYEKLYFNMKTLSMRDSCRLLTDKCVNRCRKHLKGCHTYKLMMDHAVKNMIKMKAQDIETDEATAINGIASKIYDDVFPLLTEQCEVYITEYIEKHSRGIMEMDKPDVSNDDIDLSKSIVFLSSVQCMDGTALFKNLFPDIKSKVKRTLRRKQKQQEQEPDPVQSEKYDESSEEDVAHVSDDIDYDLSAAIIRLSDLFTELMYAVAEEKEIVLLATKECFDELCSSYLTHIYDPTATKLICSKLVQYRISTLVFCIHEVLIAVEYAHYNLCPQQVLNVRRWLLKLGLEVDNVVKITWFIKTVDDQFG